MDNPYVHAIVLGIIQGIAELFPVSSAAHTLLISALLGWPLPSLPFVVMLHLGTFLAVLIYFARDYWQLVVGFFKGFGDKFAGADQRLSLLVIAGTIPLFLIGKAGEPFFDQLFGMPIFAACFLLLTGLVLFLIERLQNRPIEHPADVPHESLNPKSERMYFPEVRRPDDHPGAAGLSWVKAILVGLSQVGGLFPGGSRSGFSIAAGMWAGLTREEAARFSFLLAGPAILGASAFEFLRILKPEDIEPGESTLHGVANLAAPPEPHLVIATGFIVALVVGMFAIRFFMRYVNDHKLTPFAYYCWAFGLVTLGLLLSRAHH